jgi:dihydroxy-acid dehydratase
MELKVTNKNRLPSRHVTEGPSRAPHRSYLYAMGLTTEQIHQPFVGVATCWNEAAPCNISLMRQAQAVKKGVAAAAGTPREFCTITVTDGIAMGHEGMKSSLASREVIADSVELTMRGHCYDALVGMAGCDKSLPGMMMAMVRLNVPSIFIYGGSILPGTFRGRRSPSRTCSRPWAGIRSATCRMPTSMNWSRRRARRRVPAAPSSPPTPWRRCRKPSAWRCPIRPARPRHTSFATSSATPRASRSWSFWPSNIRPRDIVTRKALENAATVVAASGGSTNAGLHLPAIAHECGIKFDLFDVAEIFKRTPYIADLKPGGKYVAKDMFEAGGIPLLMKTLLDHGFLHGDCLTVTGRTIAENMASVKWNPDQDVVRSADKPLSPNGGVVGLKGNLAPQGAIVKVAGMQKLSSPARRGASTPKRRASRPSPGASTAKARSWSSAMRGPGRPRHARDAVDHRGALRPGHGRQGGADHRRPVFGRHPRLLHRSCRTGSGARRADRAVEGRRRDRDRRHRGHARRAPRRPGTDSPGQGLEAARPGFGSGACGNTPSRSARPSTAR